MTHNKILNFILLVMTLTCFFVPAKAQILKKFSFQNLQS
jgi:hypothetical protein